MAEIVDERNLSLTEKAANDLLTLLLERGYLHENVQPIQADPGRGNPQKEIPDLPLFSEKDPSCQVVFLQNISREEGESCCCTYSVLEQKLHDKLKASGGRRALATLCKDLRLKDERPLLRILEEQKAAAKTLFQVGPDVISDLYLDRQSQEILTSIMETPKEGFALVSTLATEQFHLPMDLTLEALQERLPDGIQILSLESGIALVSDKYLQGYKKDVLETFSAFTEPVLISEICHHNNWDNALVAPWVQELCQTRDLLGDFRGGSNATSVFLGAVYTPHAHVFTLRKEVDDLFATQGYLTAEKGLSLGLSKSKMGEYVRESFPFAVLISESLIVNLEKIITPIEAILQDAIISETFVDLNEHIAPDILQQEWDARSILNDHVVPNLVKQDDSKRKKTKEKSKTSSVCSVGTAVVCSSGGLFVSAGMIRHIQEQILPGLVNAYAKERAEQIDAIVDANASENVAQHSTKKKGGRKGKKATRAEDIGDNLGVYHEETSYVLPLGRVVEKILEIYPELSEVDPLVKERLDKNQLAGWEDAYDRDVDDSPVYAFCRTAFYTEEFVLKCKNAIETELRQLQSARVSKASLSRKNAATRVRNVESAFEESLNTACFMLQCHYKFLQYVENSEPTTSGDSRKEFVIEKLKEQMLQGCCADLTSRLTQYCIFKNEVADDKFGFLSDSSNAEEVGEEEGKGSGEDALPPYCIPTDLAVRKYPLTFLSYQDSGEAKLTDPQPKLREELPGSIGVTLARQWSMCGGSCYQGGTKVNNNGQQVQRPGDVKKFMSHIEENCLSLCGYPYKKLDKKSEKLFLFARRQRLLHLLEASTDAGDVLDFAVMLLFQQIKNVVVSGDFIRRDILEMLVSERKIGEDVGRALSQLAHSLAGSGPIDKALIETVRACGLAKDISKHVVRE